MNESEKEPTKEQKIWQVVAAIPKGKVASYGQVAAMAGLGCVEHAAHDTDDTRRTQLLRLVESHPAMNGIALARCHAAAVSLRCGCC